MTYKIKANGVDPAQAYGAVIVDRVIGAKEKSVVIETVPYMNGFYDLSGLGEGPHYRQRELTYKLSIFDSDTTSLFEKYEGLASWLNGINGSDLYDDVFPSKHFTNATTTKIKLNNMQPNAITVTATIVCDPDMAT